jgi:outer membrane protein assembly factor BamB
VTDATDAGRRFLTVFVTLLTLTAPLGAAAAAPTPASAQSASSQAFDTAAADLAAPSTPVPALGAGDVTAQTTPGETATADWNVSVGGDVAGQPLVANGTVYAAGDATLHALNASTGQEAWNLTLDGDVVGAPVLAADGEAVYVATTNGTLYAANVTSEAIAWAVDVGGAVEATPAVDGTSVYVGTNDATLVAVDAVNESTQWTFTTSARVSTGAPTVGADGTVYVGDQSGTLYAVGQTGSAVWNASVASNGSVFAPTLAGGNVVVTAANGTVAAYEAGTGAATEAWNASLPGSAVFGPVTNGQVVVAGTTNGTLVGYDPGKGDRRWTTTVPGASLLGPQATGVATGFLVGTDDGTAHGLSTGGLVLANATVGASGTIASAPAATSGRAAVVGTSAGRVVAVDPLAPRAPSVDVTVEDATLAVGETASVNLTLSNLTTGLSGINATLSTDPSVLAVRNATASSEFILNRTPASPANGTAEINGVDLDDTVDARYGSFVAGTVELEAVGVGSTALGANVTRLEDDYGRNVTGTVTDGAISVTRPAVETDATVRVDPADRLVAGDNATLPVVLNDTTAAGVDSYNLTLTVANGSVLNVTDAATEGTNGFTATGAPTITRGTNATTVRINATDPQNQTVAGETNVTLARLDVDAATVGASDLSVTVDRVIGDDGALVNASGVGTTQEVAPPEPNVTVSNLSVDPNTVLTGENVTAGVDVANDGTAAGTYQVNFTVNGSVVDTRTGTLEAGTATTETYVTSFGTPDDYTVGVEGVGAETVTVSAQPTPNVTVSNLAVTPTDVLTGENVTVTADVENDGTAAGSYQVNVTQNGTTVATRTGTLEAGTATTVSYVTNFSTPGDYALGVEGLGTELVRVADPAVANVTVSNLAVTPTDVLTGENVTVTADVENDGSAEGSYDVRVTRNGTTVATLTGTIGAGDATTVSYVTNFSTPGDYALGVEGLGTELVRVADPAPGPTVRVTNVSIAPNETTDEGSTDHVVRFNVSNVSADGDEDTFNVTLEPGLGTVTSRGSQIYAYEAATGDRIARSSGPETVDAAGGTDNRITFGVQPTNSSAPSDPFDAYAIVRFTVGYDDRTASIDSQVTASVADSTNGRDANTTALTVRDAAQPNVTVSNLSVTPTSVQTGQTVTVTADVTNGGDAAGTYSVDITRNGSVVATRSGTVGAGNVTTVSYVTNFSTPGDYALGVAGLGSELVRVADPTAGTVTLSNLSVTPTSVGVNESITVSVLARNDGTVPANYSLNVTVEATTVETLTGQIPPNETRIVSTTVTLATPGNVSVGVGGLGTRQVSVRDLPLGERLFPDGLPGGNPASGVPTDPNGDGRLEDLDGNGQFEFVDVIEFVFALDGLQSTDLTASQRTALDFDGDEDVDFVDVIELVFQLPSG